MIPARCQGCRSAFFLVSTSGLVSAGCMCGVMNDSLWYPFINTLKGCFSCSIDKILRRLWSQTARLRRSRLELLASNLVRQSCLLPCVKYPNVSRLAGKVQLRLLLSKRNREMGKLVKVDSSQCVRAITFTTNSLVRTHFPDGRIVTPRKIAAASAAARSFLPPLAALTA